MAAKPRAEQATSEEKRRRVFYIARAMVAGEWGDGKAMTKQLMREWRLAEKTVQHMAAEASRLLDFHVNDRDSLVRLGQLRLREIGEENGADRVQAWKTLFENLGELRKRMEVSGPAGAPLAVGGTVTVKLEALEHVRALLRDPPPELEAVLNEEWGPRMVTS